MTLSIPFPHFEVLLPELILVGAALLAITWEMITRTRSHLPSFLICLAGTLAALAAVAGTAGITVSTFADCLVLDPFATFFKAVLGAALLLTLLLSWRLLRGERVEEHAEYYGLLLLAGAGMMLMAGARELITIFLSLELLSISLYVLCGFFRHDLRSNEAAVKYFILGSFGTGFLLFGMSYVYGATGTTHLTGIASAIAADPAAAGSRGLMMGMLIMLSGFAFKIAAVPFHQWTPDVYEGAPTPVTAFMATATKAAAFAALLRVLTEGLAPVKESWEALFTVLAVLSMTVGNLAALAQDNVKRMLAYSSIAHAGYLLIGVVAAVGGDGRVALGSVLFYLLAYTFMNIGAFALVLLLRGPGPATIGPRGVAVLPGERIADFAGLSRRSPWAAFAMLVFLFSLAGVPPTAGFAAKFGVFYAAVQGKYWLLLVAGVLNSAVAAYYYLRLVVVMYMTPPAEEAAPGGHGAALAFAIALSLLAVLWLGLSPGPFYQAAREAVAGLVR